MNIYYKYLSYIDEETFINPTIRLSVPEHLNDPFESSACNTLQSKFKIKSIFDDSDIMLAPIKKHVIKNDINKYCIVSLSETSRNLLMWSHYANEHRGICIGYYEDFLEPETNTTTKMRGHFKPIQVKYDSLRYYSDENEDKLTSEGQIFKALTNKSNDWIYEKEHRCIVPTYYADIIKISKITPIDRTLLMKLYGKDHVGDIKPGKYEYSKLNEYKLAPDYSLAKYFTVKKDSVLLKKILPSKINRIYFGCRFPLIKINNIISGISNPSHPLHHVKLFRYEIDDERFELKEIPVHSPTSNPHPHTT